MGILRDNPDEDVELIKKIAGGICDLWNDNGGPQHGVQLFVGEQKVREVSQRGKEVLEKFFPTPPGAFKRLATLLVISRLKGLFCLASVESTNGNIVQVNENLYHQWLPRICFLMIPPVMDMLEIRDEKGNLKKLDWKNFPSLHSKAEFILWLQWLREMPELKNDVCLDRNGRMVLATSLILEAIYYQNGNGKKADICALCDNTLKREVDHSLLFFDSMIHEEIIKPKTT